MPPELASVPPEPALELGPLVFAPLLLHATLAHAHKSNTELRLTSDEIIANQRTRISAPIARQLELAHVSYTGPESNGTLSAFLQQDSLCTMSVRAATC